MNTNNVMSMIGGVQTARSASVYSRSKAMTGGKGSFDDALTKSKGDSLTLQDVKDLAQRAEAAEKDAKLAEAAEKVGTEADMPKENKSADKTDDKIGDKAAKDNSKTTEDNLEDDLNEDIDDGNKNLAASATFLQFDATADLEGLEVEESLNNNLQTILPQDSEVSGKNKEMLAMLSGQHIPKQEGDADLNNARLKSFVDLPKSLNMADLKNVENLTKPLNDVDTNNLEDLTKPLNSADTNNLSNLAKNLDNMGAKAEANVSDEPVFTRVQATDPLSAAAKDMASTVKGGEAVFENTLKTSVIASQNGFANVKVVDNSEKLVNNVVNNLEPDSKNADIKGQIMSETAKTVDPVLQNIQPVKPENVQRTSQQNPLAGVVVEVEDVDAISIPKGFENFSGQNTDSKENQNQNQNLFNNNGDEVVKTDNASKSGAERVENNQQFAHALETQNMQQTSSARQTAPTTAMPRDDYNIREQIVQQARLIRAENGTEMVIRLKPEHLGDMTLRISVSSEGAVTASFFTDNAQVRHIVENSLVQLRQELQNQGIKVDKAEVYAGLSDGNLPQGQGQEAWQQNQGSGNSSRGQFVNSENIAAEFEDAAAETLTNSPISVVADDRVDYLV